MLRLSPALYGVTLLPFFLLPASRAALNLPAPETTVPSACADLPHPDHPMARLTNGKLTVAVFLPDAERGYYRGSRFDWSGIVGCASLNGHTFFGEWFNRYDPMTNDAVTGPAEEFRHPTSELGYDDAAPGGPFIKIGVGVLQRKDASAYSFGEAYPIVDHGKWSVKVHGRSITFRQVLHSKIGYAYKYEKVLSLDAKGSILTLEHHLKSLGSKPIDTAVYDHDFYMLDGKPTGPGMEIHYPFVPLPDKPLPESARIDGTTVQFLTPLQPRHGLGAYVTGFSDKVSAYDLTVEDKTTGIGVEQTADSPIIKSYLWATPTTICPEAYIGIHIAPGQTQSWTIHYRFFTHGS